MRYLKIAIIVFILLADTGQIYCQQVPIYSQYIMNGFIINPSLAGLDGYKSVNLAVRQQWIGIKGGPSTFTASFQMSPSQNLFGSRSRNVSGRVSKPIKAGNMGLGGYVFNDNNGIIHRTGFMADYAYHIPFGKNESEMKYLSMGLALTAYQLYIKTEDLKYSYSDDPFLNSYDKSVFITDFNFGTSFVTRKYFFGFSMTNILRGSLIYANSSENKMDEIGHFYLTGGINIPVSRDWSVKPSALFKTSDLLFKSLQLDVTTRLFYKENYWAGVSYRTSDAVVFMFGLRYENFYIGNAFDFTLSDIRKTSIGSFEISLAYKFGESARDFKWLNLY